MRFITTINNKKCLEWKITATQGALVSLIYEANSWAKEIIVDDKVYYYISRNLILQELPLFFEKSDTVYRNLKTLNEKGIIEYIKQGKKDLIRLTEKGKTWNSVKYEREEKNSEINPKKNENSDSNPIKLGNKSEKNSDSNPTNKDSNIHKDTNTSSKEKYKKEKKKNEIEDFVNSLEEEHYRILIFEYINYRKEIKKPLKTIAPIKKLVREFPSSTELSEAIQIAKEREWTGLEKEWVENYKKSKLGVNNGNNTGNNGKKEFNKHTDYKPDYSKGFDDWN